VIAGSIVTAHNHVLRRWLREDLDDAGARAALDRALGLVLASVSAAVPGGAEGAGPGSGGGDGTTVVVLRSGATIEQVLPHLREALATDRPHGRPSPA